MFDRHLIHVWAPSVSQFGGGVTQLSREFLLALNRLGLSSCFFSKDDSYLGFYSGVRVVGAGWAPSFLRALAFGITVVAFALLKRPRLIVCMHANFGPFAFFLRRVFGFRYVTVAHGIEISGDLSFLRISALCGSLGVWSVSSWTKARLLSVGVAESVIAILPNTVDGEQFTIGPKPTYLERRYGLDGSSKVILTVARLCASEGYKGYDRVIDALDLVKAPPVGIVYLIVGKGDDHGRVVSLVSSRSGRHRTILCGYVAQDELADHYRLADAYVMPSMGEGFGIVFLEALACGTPCIAGVLDGSVDALASGELGRLVDPQSSRQIADAIMDTLNKSGPAFWFQREQLREECLRMFGREAFDRRLLALLRSLDLGPFGLPFGLVSASLHK